MKNYFTIAEMTRSETASRLKINNNVPDEIKPNIINLINNILNPLREAYGKPIIVNSGYRCRVLNKQIGGVPTSDHIKGMAADITGGNPKENKKIFELAQKLKLPFKQLIDEKKYRWIHISYDNKNVKRQILHL